MRKLRLAKNVLQAFQSNRVVLPDGIVRRACVLVENEKIQSVIEHGTGPANARLNDFGNHYMLPGLIDSHIHINDPGRTEWEGFETATRAAAAGGFTCLVDMPLNSVPATTDLNALERKRSAAQGRALVDYRFWGGAVRGNADQLKALAQAGVAGFKSFLVHPGIEEFSMVDEADLHVAMPIIAECGLPLLIHAESPGPIDATANAAGEWHDYSDYLASRPDSSEVEAIQLLIRLCAEYRCAIHIVHLSSAEALEALREARRQGLPITVETCPHYLYFAAESIQAGATAFKCAPPIRRQANQDALWKALDEGQIDLIATDHSPCPPRMKKMEIGDFRQAWGGIASVSVALPAVWTKASTLGFGMEHVVKWCCEKPAILAGVSTIKGKISTGCDADFTIFDETEAWQVRFDDLHFRNKVSPYVGEHFMGRVKSTFLRGECVYDGHGFGAVHGRECTLM